MKNTIIMWTMMVLLSFLTACGGSDSSDSSNFSKSDGTTEEDTTGGTDDDKEDQPDPVVEDNVLVALGIGSGTGFQAGIAKTGLSAAESLSASGSTTVTVDLVDLNDNKAQFLGLREVSFVSTCSSAGLAEFTPESIKTSGSATVTYKDLGCGKELGATDNVVVYIAEETDNPNATARTTINVQAAQIGAIQFMQAAPSLIALSGYGAGAVPSLSNLVFQVVDRSGNPMPDRTVEFELDHDYGGAALSLAKAITGADGQVNVMLSAGAAAGTIRVKASIDVKDSSGAVDKTITTMSTPITMATSLGDQNSFSLSAAPFNPNAWAKDGETVKLSARLGDHNQNPVIDGTRIYFRATGGMIDPSCETVSGTCSVNWQSSNPRPIDGHVTVVAFTRGQGDFQDTNSNGLFDLGESFTTYDEAYIDANGNESYETNGQYQPDVDIDGDGTPEFGWAPNAYRVYTSSGGSAYVEGSSNFFEEFIDSNDNGVIDEATDVKYQGVNCSDAALAAGHCGEQIDIVDTIRLEMSNGEGAYIEGPFGWDESTGRFNTDDVLTCVDGSSVGQKVAWRIADSAERRNHLPSGTSIAIVTDDTETQYTSGDGSIDSKRPAAAWPAWSALAENAPKAPAVQKYDYLNTRGHFVEASVIRAESFTTFTWIGQVGINVNTIDGGTVAGGFLDVDLEGLVARLFRNNVEQSEVDVTGGAQTYTLKIKNRCNTGLPDAATLSIELANGQLDGVTIGGNAESHDWTAGNNNVNVEIDASQLTTIVNLTISTDSTSGDLPNALKISYSEPLNGDVVTVDLNDFNIKD